MTPLFFSLFTGADGAGEGARQAGYEVVGGVEYRADLAAIATTNHPGARVIVGDVRTQDYAALPWRIDHLHASPSCKKASIANADRGETDEDRETGQAVCRAIRATRPASFTLENVRGYGAFDAYATIVGTLRSEGYGLASGILNAANYGVPQTRERLIVVAVRGLPDWAVSLPPATHARRGDDTGQLALFDAPPLPPWVGWYEAIHDLIPTLPASQFAPWQLARLPEEVREGLVVHPTEMRGEGHRYAGEPLFTVLAGSQDGDRGPWAPRAFIVDGQPTDHGARVAEPHGNTPMLTVHAQMGARQAARAWLIDNQNASTTQPRLDDEPAMTITTRGSDTGGRLARAWLAAGHVVQMTPRALARFQSFPDAYVWPERASLACEAIGNAVPPLLMRRVMERVRALVARVPRQEAA